MPKNKVYKTKDGRYDYYVTDASGNRKQLKSRVNEILRDFKTRCDQLDREAEGTVTSDTMDDLFQLWIDQHVKPKLSASEIRVTVPIDWLLFFIRTCSNHQSDKCRPCRPTKTVQ